MNTINYGKNYNNNDHKKNKNNNKNNNDDDNDNDNDEKMKPAKRQHIQGPAKFPNRECNDVAGQQGL
jgi:hypothetical protein